MTRLILLVALALTSGCSSIPDWPKYVCPVTQHAFRELVHEAHDVEVDVPDELSQVVSCRARVRGDDADLELVVRARSGWCYLYRHVDGRTSFVQGSRLPDDDGRAGASPVVVSLHGWTEEVRPGTAMQRFDEVGRTGAFTSLTEDDARRALVLTVALHDRGFAMKLHAPPTGGRERRGAAATLRGDAKWRRDIPAPEGFVIESRPGRGSCWWSVLAFLGVEPFALVGDALFTAGLVVVMSPVLAVFALAGLAGATVTL